MPNVAKLRAMQRTLHQTQTKLLETQVRVIDLLRAALDALKDMNVLILETLRVTEALSAELDRK